MASIEQVIEQTQQKLSSLIKRTPLTAKLLQRPPFRYLHDLISELISACPDFAPNLYTPDELNSANVTDKEAKIAFLQKIMDHVSQRSGQQVRARPAKIVAGLDPEDTNAFLQLLAGVAATNTASTESVKKSASTGKKSSADSLNEKAVKPTSSQADLKKPEKERPDRIQQLKTSDAAALKKTSSKTALDPKEKKKTSSEKLDKVKSSSKSELNPKPKTKEESRLKSEAKASQRDSSITNLSAAPNEPVKSKSHSTKNEAAALPELGSEKPNAALGTAPATPAARPMTAKPPPPKPKRQEVEEPAIVEAPPVFLETKSKIEEEESDELVILQGAANNETADASSVLLRTGADQDLTEHGGLVRKILETNQSLGGATQANGNKAAHAEEFQQALAKTNRTKERAATKKETDSIREQIQNICRSVVPFGKLFDYYQEDMDAMQRELSNWKEESKRHQSILDGETKETNRILEPLEKQIQQLDEQIQNQSNKIHEMRAKVLQNDQTIHKLMENVVGPISIHCLR